MKAIVTKKKNKKNKEIKVWLTLHTMACNVAAPSTQSEFVNYDRVSFETSGSLLLGKRPEGSQENVGPFVGFSFPKYER